MVGSCPHCSRPWYAVDEQSIPDTCRGCSKPLTEENTPETFEGESELPPLSPEEVVSEVNRINSEVQGEADQQYTSNVSTIILAAGLGLLIFAGLWGMNTWSFTTSAREVTGLVVAVENWQSSKRTKSICQIEYHAGGKKQMLRTSAGEYKQGDHVALLVSASDPTDARHPDVSTLWGWPIALAVFGCISLAVGFVLRGF